MSVHRLFVWTCEGCGTAEQKHDYGLPKGWRWVAAAEPGGELEHRCPTCPIPEKRAFGTKPPGK